MKKWATIAIASLLYCAPAPYSAEAANIKDFPTVAVMDFGNKAVTSRGLRGHDMSMATEYAIYQLSNSGWFDLIDYEQLSTLAKMQNINSSGFIDPSTAVPLGRIAGAKFVVVGYVTGLTTKENVVGVQAHNARAGNAAHVVNANVTVRIVDVETGRIVAAGIGKGSSTSTMTEIGFTKYRTKRNVRAETVGQTVVNDVKDELATRATDRANRTTAADERSITGGMTDTYNQNDRTHSTDTDDRSGGKQSSNGGTSSSSAFDRGQANQNGTSGQTSSTAGSYDRTYDDNRDRNLSGSDNSSASASYDRDSRQSGDQSGYRDQEWEEGHSGLHTWGGPAEGVVTGRGKGMGWDVTVYNDRAEYDMGYASGSNNERTGSRYDNAQSDRERAHSDTNRDYNERLDDDRHIEDHERDSRYTDNNQRYNDNQSYNRASGSSGQYENHADSSYNDNRTQNHDGSFDSDINRNQNYNYNDTGSRANTADDSYRDAQGYRQNNTQTVTTGTQFATYDEERMDYSITIGTVEVSDVQVRNAISKAVRDAIYGKTGLMTTLNGGKQLKIKTGF